MLSDANGIPLRFLPSGSQASDISYAQPLLDEVSIPSSQSGRLLKRYKWLLADKIYNAEALKDRPELGLPRLFDQPKYRQRNIIQRMFGWLKENRGIVTRFDMPAKSYAVMVLLAYTMR